MSPGNLFHYYASKAEIIEALIASDTDTLREHRQAAAGDARAALIGWVDENLAQYRDPGFARLGMEILAEAVRNPRVHTLVMANAVSYTHLDVYKRQAWAPSSRNGCSSSRWRAP